MEKNVFLSNQKYKKVHNVNSVLTAKEVCNSCSTNKVTRLECMAELTLKWNVWCDKQFHMYINACSQINLADNG